jgi:hypothetical protein
VVLAAPLVVLESAIARQPAKRCRSRDNAVDRLCAVALPGEASSFWISSSRLALASITLFLVYESERKGGAEATFSGALT